MCVCARACACVRLCVSATVHVCVCLCAHVCARCVPVHLLLHACIPVNFSSCITTECQCSANCTILWGQTKVCKFCMAASPSSCGPLPLLLLSLVHSCLLQPGGVWGERRRRSGGGHSLCSSLRTINIFATAPLKLIRFP